MGKSVYTQEAWASPYWNEALETMPREELDALHLRRLRALIAYAYRKVPMYQDIYDRAGVKLDDIRTLDDYVEKLPTIDKGDVLRYQVERKSTVADSEQYRCFLFQTSGTTGRTLLEPGAFPDFLNNFTHQWWAHGIRPGDSIYFAFPFGIFMAFWSAYFDTLFSGPQVISGGGADSKMRIRQILKFRPAALVATPTYALRLAEVAREMGVDSRTTSIRVISTTGEPGPMVPSIRRAIEEAWNAKVFDTYGLSELWGSTSWECPVRPERMHLGETKAYGIVVDEEGRLVPSGGRGEFILTSYEVSVQPLIKYRTHDVVEWHKEPCECGRTWLWLRGGVLARTDQMVAVKGTNVFPSAIQALLGEIASLSERMEVHIGRDGGFDRVWVKVESAAGIGERNFEGLRAQAEELLRGRIGVGIPVEIVPPLSLPRYELKAKFVFDHRPKGVG